MCKHPTPYAYSLGMEVGACNVNMHVNVAQHGLAATVVDDRTERTFKSVIIEQQRQLCLEREGRLDDNFWTCHAVREL